MPIESCPACEHPTPPRNLEEASKDATVNYYRCGKCGHIWTVSKDGRGTVHHVTPLPHTET